MLIDTAAATGEDAAVWMGNEEAPEEEVVPVVIEVEAQAEDGYTGAAVWLVKDMRANNCAACQSGGCLTRHWWEEWHFTRHRRNTPGRAIHDVPMPMETDMDTREEGGARET